MDSILPLPYLVRNVFINCLRMLLCTLVVGAVIGVGGGPEVTEQESIFYEVE